MTTPLFTSRLVTLAALAALGSSAALAHEDSSEAGTYHWILAHAGDKATPAGSGSGAAANPESYSHERLERGAASDKASARETTGNVVVDSETAGYQRLQRAAGGK